MPSSHTRRQQRVCRTRGRVADPEFAALDKEKTAIAEKIRLAVENIQRRTNPSGAVGQGDPRNTTSFEIEDLRKKFDALEKRSAELRAQIDATVNTAKEKIGHETFTDIGRLLGGELAKSLQHGAAALAEWYHNIPEINKATVHMADNMQASIQRMAGNIGTFRAQMEALTQDLKDRHIGQELFDQLSQKATLDQFARSLRSVYDQIAPRVETMARFFDSGFGLSATFGKYFGALGQVGEMFPGKVGHPKDAKLPAPFRAQFVGLEDMGRRIQEAAASGDPSSDSRSLEAIAKFTQDTAKNAERTAKSLENIEKARTPAYAVVK